LKYSNFHSITSTCEVEVTSVFRIFRLQNSRMFVTFSSLTIEPIEIIGISYQFIRRFSSGFVKIESHKCFESYFIRKRLAHTPMHNIHRYINAWHCISDLWRSVNTIWSSIPRSYLRKPDRT